MHVRRRVWCILRGERAGHVILLVHRQAVRCWEVMQTYTFMKEAFRACGLLFYFMLQRADISARGVSRSTYRQREGLAADEDHDLQLQSPMCIILKK